MDLDLIQFHLKKYKEAKEPSILHTKEKLKWGEVFVVWDYNNYDYKFLEVAKSTPLETYCEELLQRVKELEGKNANT